MSTNLVSSIVQFLTPDLIAKIASALGLDRSVVQRAITAGTPAILAGLASLASKPGGAQQLSGALAQHSSSMLSQFTNALGGSAQTALAEEGTDALSSLLGRGGLGSLASAIGSYAGISQGKSESLLGLLAPIALGVIGQQQRKSGLDANGLASQLAAQKNQIMAALPSGFADELSSSGFLDTLDANFRRSAETAATAARRVGGMGDEAVAAASRAASATARSAPTWPYWLAGFAILLGLGWYFLTPQDGARVAEQTGRPATPASETVGRATPGQTVAELTGAVKSSVGAMSSALQGITDLASAQAAMPKLQQMTAELDKINNAVAQLPPDARTAVASQVATAMPTLNQLCEKVLAIPGVASIAKPLIDAMRSKLDTMARA
jgi:hypothetical protein